MYNNALTVQIFDIVVVVAAFSAYVALTAVDISRLALYCSAYLVAFRLCRVHRLYTST